MIDLTPLEVRKKKGDFRKAMRGYEPALVDDFLDLAADRMEQLVRENMTLADRVARLEAQVSDYREREKALTEALVTAQEMREETRRQATRDAELVRREAEQEASDIIASANQAKQKEEAALRHLRAQRAQLIKSFRAFLERELAEIAVAEESMGLRRKGSRKGADTADLFADTAEMLDDAALAEPEAQEPPRRKRRAVAAPAPEPLQEPEPEPEPIVEETLLEAESLELVDVAELAPSDELTGGLDDDDDIGDLDVRIEADDDEEEAAPSSTDLFGEPVTQRKSERRIDSLAALEEEVLRELQQEVRSADKAALLSSVLEEEV